MTAFLGGSQRRASRARRTRRASRRSCAACASVEGSATRPCSSARSRLATRLRRLYPGDHEGVRRVSWGAQFDKRLHDGPGLRDDVRCEYLRRAGRPASAGRRRRCRRWAGSAPRNALRFSRFAVQAGAERSHVGLDLRAHGPGVSEFEDLVRAAPTRGPERARASRRRAPSRTSAGLG